MGLEDPFYIPELDQTNPAAVDDISEGDDHLRRLKRAILGSFPAFVGTQASPKSVNLTEDQLNDALLKSVAQVITGQLTVDAILQVINRGSWVNSFIVGGGNDPSQEDQRALRLYHAIFGPTMVAQMDPALGGIFQINATTNQAGDFTGSDQFTPAVALQVFDATIFSANTLERGGATTFTRDGQSVRAGYRNPPARDLGSNHTLAVEDESSALVFNSATDVTLTVPSAEVRGVEVAIINRSGTGSVNITGSGVTLEYFSGGNSSGGPLTLDPLSVCQLYFRETNICCVWGNGVSGP